MNTYHYGLLNPSWWHKITYVSFFLFIIISADEDKDGAQDRMKTKIKVNHNGTNTWLAPTILQSSCKINVRYFPFDEQVGFIALDCKSWSLEVDMQAAERSKSWCSLFSLKRPLPDLLLILVQFVRPDTWLQVYNWPVEVLEELD